MAKTAIQEFGWTVEEFDDTDYYRLVEILGASDDPEEREVDPASFLGL